MNPLTPSSGSDDGLAASPSPHVVFGLDGPREILDACCGGRMWWWDKEHPLAVYMDVREAPRGSVGELTGRPEWNPNWSCEPTCKGDFRNMPFEDESFQMVVFDPPHVTREKQPPEGINGLKYGALHPETEQEDLRLGFAECWRVLRPGGTLVFKWGAGSIKRVEPHFPAAPIVGTRSPRGGQTRWFIFYKPLDAAELEAVATCSRCKRGAEACGYCEGIEERDWESICDCGLYDFGDHLLDCEARVAFKYVVAGDHEQAKVPRV